MGKADKYSSPSHPQSNGQEKSINKIIKGNLKKKLEGRKGNWMDEMLSVLWAYNTTQNVATEETLLASAFEIDAVINVEIGIPSNRTAHFNEDNMSLIAADLDLSTEKRARVELQMAT